MLGVPITSSHLLSEERKRKIQEKGKRIEGQGLGGVLGQTKADVGNLSDRVVVETGGG